MKVKFAAAIILLAFVATACGGTYSTCATYSKNTVPAKAPAEKTEAKM